MSDRVPLLGLEGTLRAPSVTSYPDCIRIATFTAFRPGDSVRQVRLPDDVWEQVFRRCGALEPSGKGLQERCRLACVCKQFEDVLIDLPWLKPEQEFDVSVADFPSSNTFTSALLWCAEHASVEQLAQLRVDTLQSSTPPGPLPQPIRKLLNDVCQASGKRRGTRGAAWSCRQAQVLHRMVRFYNFGVPKPHFNPEHAVTPAMPALTVFSLIASFPLTLATLVGAIKKHCLPADPAQEATGAQAACFLLSAMASNVGLFYALLGLLTGALAAVLAWRHRYYHGW